MIPLDSLLVTWWHRLITFRRAPGLWRRGTVDPMRSPISLLCGLRPSLLLLRRILLLPPIDIIISNPGTLAAVVGNFLVVGLRIGGDYIPGMEEAGKKTKNA